MVYSFMPRINRFLYAWNYYQGIEWKSELQNQLLCTIRLLHSRYCSEQALSQVYIVRFDVTSDKKKNLIIAVQSYVL